MATAKTMKREEASEVEIRKTLYHERDDAQRFASKLQQQTIANDVLIHVPTNHTPNRIKMPTLVEKPLYATNAKA